MKSSGKSTGERGCETETQGGKAENEARNETKQEQVECSGRNRRPVAGEEPEGKAKGKYVSALTLRQGPGM